jgi:hypothetical protein
MGGDHDFGHRPATDLKPLKATHESAPAIRDNHTEAFRSIHDDDSRGGWLHLCHQRLHADMADIMPWVIGLSHRRWQRAHAAFFRIACDVLRIDQRQILTQAASIGRPLRNCSIRLQSLLHRCREIPHTHAMATASWPTSVGLETRMTQGFPRILTPLFHGFHHSGIQYAYVPFLSEETS